MRTLLAVLTVLVTLSGDAVAQGKLEQTEIDAWLVRDAQMSSQFAVAEALGYFKAEGLKVTPRWYIAGTDLPSMWGAGNIHLGMRPRRWWCPSPPPGSPCTTSRPRATSPARSRSSWARGTGDRPLAEGLREAEDRHAQGRLGDDGHPGHGPRQRHRLHQDPVVNLSPPDAVTALVKGDIDAMAAWAPWVFNAVKQGGGKVYFTGNRSFIPGKEGQVDWLHVHAGVVASGKMVKESPNTLKAVLRALRKATDSINTDREGAVKIVAREMKTRRG